MIDIKSLTDVELTIIFRGVSLIKDKSLSGEEHRRIIYLRNELHEEVGKRRIDITGRWK